MQCATHPNVETELACGKCGKPICPRCLVYTPVGTRCRECANLRKLPQYNISAAHFVRAVVASAVVSAALGVVWGLIAPIGLIGLIAGLGVGYGVGESVSLATNRKVGVPLQIIAVAGVVLAFVIRDAVFLAQFVELRRYNVNLGDLLSNDIYGWIAAFVAAFVAAGRLR
jgi:hypothetical protein